MRMSYKKLWLMLVEKEISAATLRKDLNIATGTMTKLRRNEEVALSVLLPFASIWTVTLVIFAMLYERTLTKPVFSCGILF